MPTRLDELGGRDDVVTLKLADQVVTIYNDYEVKASVLQQPAAFSLRLGWGEVAAGAISGLPPKTPFELRVGPVVVMTGETDFIGVPNGSVTQIEVRGRDALAPLFDDYIDNELSFAEKTYYELTERALREVGIDDTTIFPSNEANRKAITGIRKVIQTAPPPDSQTVQVDAQTGTRKVVYNTIKTRTGERWWDFLQRQYKLAGLFLWASGEGQYVLSVPNANQDPSYRIVRRRGQLRNEVNVVNHSFSHDTTGRYALYVVNGRAGGGKHGRKKVRAEFSDPEMILLGYKKQFVAHDSDARTQKECEYVARRHCADQRRAGWKLEYTVSGHTTPSLADRNSFAVWGPDTVVEVEDDELDLHGRFYLEAVSFKRRPETTTTLTLMRPEDLVFAQKLFPVAA